MSILAKASKNAVEGDPGPYRAYLDKKSTSDALVRRQRLMTVT
jgi:hypothetical protein